MSLTILEGSTSCICDELGDPTGGLGGCTPTTRASAPVHRPGQRGAAHASVVRQGGVLLRGVLRTKPARQGLEKDFLSIAHHRFVGEGLQEHIVFHNETRAPLRFTIELEFGTDFADIISVKQHDFALGDPLTAPETSFPISYPTAARPQAWAAGSPILLLRLLLGLEPDVAGRRLHVVAGEEPAPGVTIGLEGVRAHGRPWNVESRTSV